MIILGVVGVSLLFILYFYIKSQTLRRDLANYRRQAAMLEGDIKHIEGVTEALAIEQQMALRKNLGGIKQSGHADSDALKYTEALINALPSITSDSATGHKSATEALKKYLSHATNISFNDFNTFISEQEGKIKNQWHKKTVAGYFTLCRLLLEVLNGVPTNEGHP